MMWQWQCCKTKAHLDFDALGVQVGEEFVHGLVSSGKLRVLSCLIQTFGVVISKCTIRKAKAKVVVA